MAGPTQDMRFAPRRALVAAAIILAALVVGLALVARAPAEDLNGKLDAKQAELDQAKEQKGVLTTEISRYNGQIDRLTGEVAALRTREAAVQEDLDRAEAELAAAQHDLQVLRERLARSIEALEDRLVEIYKDDDPSALSIVLESDGFDDALGRYEYLQRIQDRNSEIVGRVRELRDETRATVERVRATRDAIAAKKAELVRTREELEDQEARLAAARERSRRALARVDDHVDRLEGDVSDIQKKIQEQLAAQSGVSPLPAGPIQGGSAGFIWPVNGSVVSGFGMRWGRQHEGVDIAVPAGTPIRAAKDGTIAFTQSEAESGGYGNYTCIDHGGGLSTCYAHQSSFAITSGSVQQGDVIGYVGCTGHCYGDHLHFEVRINGTAVDPMGYL
ncbi:MAG: peptidoglycan DD-metalloendopeptidase family protein [Solirubrobacterales bacterium]